MALYVEDFASSEMLKSLVKRSPLTTLVRSQVMRRVWVKRDLKLFEDMISKQLLFIKFNCIKHFSKRLLTTNYGLIYEEFGEPSKVLKKRDLSADIERPLETNQLLVAFKASPINPADINTIQGVYAIKPKLPAIGGNEGVAEVIRVGSDVANIKVGDRVIPALSASGTWRTYSIINANDVIKIDSSIDLMSASQLSVNPCTAYRMLRDYIDLDKGDTVLQNGANSAVGLNVIQLAKEWNLNTINVIRKRPDLDSLKQRLQQLGATHVITEEELRQKEVMEKVFKNCPKPKLALNCVGGKNATDCMRHLSFRGVMVTYGGMSRQPLTVPTGSLIFSDHKFYGFWMTRWNQQNSRTEERTLMLNSLTDLIKNGRLESPKSIAIGLDDFEEAINKSMAGFSDAKYVFVMK